LAQARRGRAHSDGIRVRVKHDRHNSLSLDVADSDKIVWAKDRVLRQSDMAPEQQCLTFECHRLEDVANFDDNNIRNDSTVYLAVPMMHWPHCTTRRIVGCKFGWATAEERSPNPRRGMPLSTSYILLEG